jgi:hypothetical protein
MPETEFLYITGHDDHHTCLKLVLLLSPDLLFNPFPISLHTYLRGKEIKPIKLGFFHKFKAICNVLLEYRVKFLHTSRFTPPTLIGIVVHLCASSSVLNSMKAAPVNSLMFLGNAIRMNMAIRS